MNENFQTLILFGTMWVGLMWFFFILGRFLFTNEAPRGERPEPDNPDDASVIDFGL